MPVLTVLARDVQTGQPIPDFRFLVNQDNVGDPFASDPSAWPSLKPPASHSPVVTAGDSTNPVVDVPAGRYLVSVLAPGFKLGGDWVKVDWWANATVTVRLQPHPLPLSKLRVHVFHDNNPVNGEDDQPREPGLAGFRIIITDAVGEVTTDYFGNVIGTQYQKDAQGHYIIGPDGRPVPIPNTGGLILTDANGDALIENIAPGKYGVQAIAPDGTDWIQTTTIEGTRVIDAWVEEGNSGWMTEEGFGAPLVWVGFVRPLDFPLPGPTEQRGTISVQVRTTVEFEGAIWDEDGPPPAMGDPVDRPWIALTDLGGNDNQVYTGRADRYGRLTIPNVPAGLYQLAVWDDPLDYIISFRTVQVPDPTTGSWGVFVSDDPVRFPGQIAIPRWYGWILGKVFRDVDGDGLMDAGQVEPEEGIPEAEVLTRFKDGSVQYRAVTDMRGDYAFDEVFELEHFTVAESGFTRFGHLTAVATARYQHPFQGPAVVYPGDLTLANLSWANDKNLILWGKKEYPVPGADGVTGTADDVTNGGISGIVFYATMRNELDPRFALPEDYEPGVPQVTVRLYEGLYDPGTDKWSKGPLLQSVQTDAWEHPVTPEGDPVLEAPGTPNYITRGVFDGGYAFDGLAEGTYVVEVEVPASCKIVDESSVNTGEGDVFEPSPPGALALAPSDPGAVSPKVSPPPYLDGSRTAKVVRLEWGQNAACDFFIYTEVPIPGRILGLVCDDLNVETDPDKIRYGDKRGIPYVPVGIRDYTGRLLATVYSDANGIFEILLPSTYTANVPSPSGIAPGMYQIIGNDPGDPGRLNPGYTADYHTLRLVFDVWPGKTTYADVALIPASSFVVDDGGQRQPPPEPVPAGEPFIIQVNRVWFDAAGPRLLVIQGRGFGARTGVVTLGDRRLGTSSWSDTRITVPIPLDVPPGPAQLLVTSSRNEVSAAGLTIHILGPGYEPPVVTVPWGGSIQAAVDAAPAESLIVVSPGTYYESLIIHKRVKLQGHGAGATVIDGRLFQSYRQQWLDLLHTLDFDGPTVPLGQAVTVLAKDGQFSQSFPTELDGFTISGAQGEVGGGVHVHAFCRYLRVGNCLISANAGGFGGALTVGRPYQGSCHNDYVRVHHCVIERNGGTSLAGAIGIFNGADHYEIDHNLITGNYSGEYGGGISHLGLSRFGDVHHNRVTYNSSFDEGGGILIGGEAPLPPAEVSQGSGEVRIYNNLVEANLANDDGGGIRLLRAGTHPIRIYNNMVVNNVSTDVGGGIALDDAYDVAIINNTIANNVTTATAEDSDGRPHAAGLASERNSAAFQATLPPGAPLFSDPVLINNLFFGNRAFWFDNTTGKLSSTFRSIDLEVVGTDNPEYLSPYYCGLTVPYPAGAHNLILNCHWPSFMDPYTTQLTVSTFTAQPDFKTVGIVADPVPTGDYHITYRSVCRGRGVSGFAVKGVAWAAPPLDFDDQPRPYIRVDIGADEYHPHG